MCLSSTNRMKIKDVISPLACSVKATINDHIPDFSQDVYQLLWKFFFKPVF